MKEFIQAVGLVGATIFLTIAFTSSMEYTDAQYDCVADQAITDVVMISDACGVDVGTVVEWVNEESD